MLSILNIINYKLKTKKEDRDIFNFINQDKSFIIY